MAVAGRPSGTGFEDSQMASTVTGSDGWKGYDSGTDWREQIDDFRRLHRIEYGSADFDEFEPAYHYGWDVGRDERFRDRSWSDFESAMQVDWERRYPDGEWGRFRGAVKRGWARAREAVEDTVHGN
jgi:hypothetical protein